jgi:preprotein translocase subunit SecG
VHILSGILTSLLILTSLFMICLVLIQRGKGGGLAGAFGGMGGSSAFGTKAGDVFTRVTMITALIWILMSMILVVLYNRGTTSAWDGDAPRTGASKAKEVPPTAAAGTGKKTAPASSSAPVTRPSPSTPSSSSAPVSVPALPAEKTPLPKSK